MASHAPLRTRQRNCNNSQIGPAQDSVTCSGGQAIARMVKTALMLMDQINFERIRAPEWSAIRRTMRSLMLMTISMFAGINVWMTTHLWFISPRGPLVRAWLPLLTSDVNPLNPASTSEAVIDLVFKWRFAWSRRSRSLATWRMVRLCVASHHVPRDVF